MILYTSDRGCGGGFLAWDSELGLVRLHLGCGYAWGSRRAYVTDVTDTATRPTPKDVTV